jgi:chromate transport protein ChrA
MNLLIVLLLLYVLLNIFAPALLDPSVRRILHFVACVIVVLLLLQALGLGRSLHLHRVC